MTLRDLLQTIVDEISNLDTEIVIGYRDQIGNWNYKPVEFTGLTCERGLSGSVIFLKLGDTIKSDSILVLEEK